jgi:hypothetical protein
MNPAKTILLAAGLIIGQHCHSQGFVNLDFETANITVVPPGTGLSTATLPGWTAYVSPSIGNPTYDTYTISYDTFALDAGGIFLEDANVPYGGAGPGGFSILPIQGNYSIYLQGASLPAALTVASIGQTGTIPIGTESLTYWSSGGALQVTFNGLPIDFLVTGTTANYDIYSADISAYAGETGQLLFTAPANDSALLDNIQFSASPVPEPSVFALTALGGLLLGFLRRR